MQISDEGTSAKVSERFQSLFETLCNRGESVREDTAVFEQYTGLYTLAAAIGVKLDVRREPVKSKKSIKWMYFCSQNEVPVLMALAWAVSGRNLEVLGSARKILDAVEPYVEGGLEFIATEILDDYFNSDGSLNVPRNVSPPLELLLLTKINELAKQAPF